MIKYKDGKIVFDLGKFMKAKSCKNYFKEGDTYCAQGKVLLATGIILKGDSDSKAHIKACDDVRVLPELEDVNPSKFFEAIRENNKGKFSKADRALLSLARKSKAFVFVNKPE